MEGSWSTCRKSLNFELDQNPHTRETHWCTAAAINYSVPLGPIVTWQFWIIIPILKYDDKKFSSLIFIFYDFSVEFFWKTWIHFHMKLFHWYQRSNKPSHVLSWHLLKPSSSKLVYNIQTINFFCHISEENCSSNNEKTKDKRNARGTIDNNQVKL